MLYTVPVDVLVYSTVTGEEYAVVDDSSRSHWRCRRYYLALEISRHSWLIRDISETSESIKPVRNCSDLAMQVGDLCIHTGVVSEKTEEVTLGISRSLDHLVHPTETTDHDIIFQVDAAWDDDIITRSCIG